jgi:hypothetical protein
VLSTALFAGLSIRRISKSQIGEAAAATAVRKSIEVPVTLFGKLFGSTPQPTSGQVAEALEHALRAALDPEEASRIIDRARRASLEPKGCAKSAEGAAVLRQRLFAIIEDVETKTGDQAVVIAADGTLCHPGLIAALEKEPDGEVLQAAIPFCFSHPHAAQEFAKAWVKKVVGYQSKPNTPELIYEKAWLLSGFVIHRLGVGITVRDTLNENPAMGLAPLTGEHEQRVKLEELACWYRIIDELAYRFIRDQRELFVDLFLDSLVYFFALQGAPPAIICATLRERSKEYANYNEWTSAEPAGTLLWNAAKHVGEAAGIERNHIFVTMFNSVFLQGIERAFVFELLTGRPRSSDESAA